MKGAVKQEKKVYSVCRLSFTVSPPPLPPATSILRQHKPSPGGKRVRFDVVTVYYFPRRQGFTSVPSQGGSSLGMARHHSSIRHYTLGEFAHEQETSHRHILRQHLRQEKLNARKLKVRLRLQCRRRLVGAVIEAFPWSERP